MFTEVISAEYIGEYKLSVLFNNGVKKKIDFYAILFLNDYPAFRPLKDIEVFRKFNVTDTLEWDNGNIDIAPETMYDMGEIEPVSKSKIEHLI